MPLRLMTRSCPGAVAAMLPDTALVSPLDGVAGLLLGVVSVCIESPCGARLAAFFVVEAPHLGVFEGVKHKIMRPEGYCKAARLGLSCG